MPNQRFLITKTETIIYQREVSLDDLRAILAQDQWPEEELAAITADNLPTPDAISDGLDRAEFGWGAFSWEWLEKHGDVQGGVIEVTPST